jgi:hypothetical protein
MRQKARKGPQLFHGHESPVPLYYEPYPTEHIKMDMPEELQISMESFAFWEEHMEAGMCMCILDTTHRALFCTCLLQL